MPIEGEYEPSTQAWVRDQVELYESSGGTQGTTLQGTGLPVVIITNRGARTGKIRKTPLMRVERGGRYAAVASQGGSPEHPLWYYNFRANPHVQLQDGPAAIVACFRFVEPNRAMRLSGTSPEPFRRRH